jgi:transposase
VTTPKTGTRTDAKRHRQTPPKTGTRKDAKRHRQTKTRQPFHQSKPNLSTLTTSIHQPEPLKRSNLKVQLSRIRGTATISVMCELEIPERPEAKTKRQIALYLSDFDLIT